MSGACAEQLVVDDADAAADIEEARALDAALADHAEQHVGGRVGPVALIPVEVGLGRSPVEDLELLGRSRTRPWSAPEDRLELERRGRLQLVVAARLGWFVRPPALERRRVAEPVACRWS